MQRTIALRTLIIMIFFSTCFVVVVARLYWVQVVQSAILVQKAQKMWTYERVLPTKRGTIIDRYGHELATDVEAFTVTINPLLLAEDRLATDVAMGLATVLQKPLPEMMALVTKRNASGQLLRNVEIRKEGWKIDRLLSERVLVWKEAFMKDKAITDPDWSGVSVVGEQTRQYPKQNLAAHVIGYVDKDGKPWTGLERSMDDVLRGRPGKVTYQIDRLGRRLPQSKPVEQRSVLGQDVVLTIDQSIQHIVEQALDETVARFRPKAMTAIVVDPNTMEVLAMANRPTYDPNQYWQYNPTSDFRNMAIQSRYEPGSTFKLVTLAGVVDRGLFDPDATYASGAIRVPGHTIRDHRRGGWGKITYLEGWLRSSNVAFVKLGYEQLGEASLRQYIDLFGFSAQTGIDLPGELDSRIAMHYPSEVAAATFGQGGIIVTPIQQLMAYAAIANGGQLMKPYIVKKVLDPQTKKVVRETKPTVVRRIVSPQVAKQVTEYLEQVVADQKRGTGRRAYVEGLRIAGKTGTANKVVNGAYASDAWVASLIGFAPVEKPRIAVAVIVDEPDLSGDSNRSGEATAPAFKTIIQQTLRYLDAVPTYGTAARLVSGLPAEAFRSGSSAVAPDEPDEDASIPLAVAPQDMQARVRTTEKQSIPRVERYTQRSVAEVQKQLASSPWTVQVIGSGSRVVSQFPDADEMLATNKTLYLITDAPQLSMPDLIGSSLREVVALCTRLDQACSFEGEGYVVSQSDATLADGAIHFVLDRNPSRPPPPSTPVDEESEDAPQEDDTTNKTSKPPKSRS